MSPRGEPETGESSSCELDDDTVLTLSLPAPVKFGVFERWACELEDETERDMIFLSCTYGCVKRPVRRGIRA
jgi:hypothetical protein